MLEGHFNRKKGFASNTCHEIGGGGLGSPWPEMGSAGPVIA
jgi:hypothetical protein